MSILYLIVSLLMLMILAYKGVPIIVAALVCSMFVLLTANIPLVEGLSTVYMKGMAGFFQSFFLIFLLGAIFGKLIEITGAAESIAKGIIDKLGTKKVVPAIIIAIGILTYGGVSLFVVLFCVYPLGMSLFKKANVSRRLFPALVAAGGATFSMTSPFTPAIQNIIPTKYLGTDVTAAALPGTICAVFTFVAVIAYLQWRANKLQASGEEFDFKHDLVMEKVEEKELPNIWISIIPMIALVVSLNVFKVDVIVAMGIGIILVLVLLFKHLPNINDIWKNVTKSSTDALIAAGNTCSAVGFGTVVAATAGFQSIIIVATSMGGNPLISAALGTTVLAGITGSASGGLGIAMPIISDYFLPLGVNPEALHRVAVMACGGLDALPHNGAVITFLVYCGITHKEGYKDLAVVAIAIPLISLTLLIALFYILPGWM